MRRLDLASFAAAATVAVILSACASDATSPPVSTEAMVGATTTSSEGTSELPATGTPEAIRAWLATGAYKTGSWKCEAAPHEARFPGAHGTNRICSNATLSAHGAGEFPVGAAAVKELFDDAGEKVIGHAMYRKLAAGTGESFYWFEDSEGSVLANGTGDTGVPKTVCVGCHSGAGSDARHSGHDLVYTQVP